MSESNKKNEFTDNEKIAYDKLCDKRLSYDNLLWQTPVLGITAQSFLYTIAFSTDNNIGDKIFATILILILGTATIQLLFKHRYHEILTSKRLLKIEISNGLEQIHNKPDKVTKDGKWKIEYWLLKQSSFKVWIIALSISTYLFFIPLISHYVCKEKNISSIDSKTKPSDKIIENSR